MNLERRLFVKELEDKASLDSGAETAISLVKELEDKVSLEQRLTPVSSKN